MSQELSKNGGTITGTTGGTCSKSGLYKATDGKMEFIQYFVAGEKFFPFPGGNAKTKCTWTLMSRSVDGSKTSFDAVKVAPGTA
jgi:hypothetical protein